MCGCICALLDLRGQAGLRAFGTVRMNVCTRVLDMGGGHPLWSGGTLTYATHVKFMFCAPFTKKSLNSF